MEEFFYHQHHDSTVIYDGDLPHHHEYFASTGLGSACLSGHRQSMVDDLFQLFEPADEDPPPPPPPPPPHHHHHQQQQQIFAGSSSSSSSANNIDHNEDDEMIMFDYLIKSKIQSHPRYPNLVSAYIDCQKVGVPPEIASSVHDNGVNGCNDLENHMNGRCYTTDDPELDQFMELYCIFLQNYKEEICKPLDEATSFLIQIERQLSTILVFNDSSSTTATTSAHCPSDEATGSSEEQNCSLEAVEVASESQKLARTSATTNAANVEYGDQALKQMLLHKYSGYLSSLRKEFTTKTKKGKLPKQARMALLDWWNSHPRWPYPTEEEKMKLVEATGLDQKQITNWFINQRKRHWKPSEDQRFALMDDITSDTLYFEVGQGIATTTDDQ